MRGQKSKFNKTNKIILVFLLLVGCFTINCEKAIAEETEEKHTVHYVSLGASNANGFGLHGYFPEEWYENPYLGIFSSHMGDSGYRTLIENSYPYLINNYIESLGFECDTDQLAQSSMRAEELRFLLDEDYTPDSYTNWRFYDPNDSSTWWYSNLDELRQDYKESITEADLITYDLGTANFTIFINENLLSNLFPYDSSYLDSDYVTLYNNFVNRLKLEVRLLGLQDTIDENIIGVLAYAYAGFCNNFDKSMEKIYELNPDVTLCVLEIQNLYDDIKIRVGNIYLPFDTIYGFLISEANSYIKYTSKYRSKYNVIDLPSRVTFFIEDLLAYNGDPTTLSRDVLEGIDCLDTSEFKLLPKFRVAMALCQMHDILCAQQEDYDSIWFPNGEYNYFLPYMASFVEKCEGDETYAQLYHKACNDVYNGIFSLFKQALSTNPLKLDSSLLSNGLNFDEISNQFGQNFTVFYTNIITAAIQGTPIEGDALTEEINACLNNDTMAAIGSVMVRGLISNCVYSHPNAQGHKEIYNAIKNQVIGKTSFIDKLTPEIVSIEVNSAQLVYPKKSTALTDDIKVYAVYSDGVKKEITSDYTITTPDMSTNGVKTVEVSYKLSDEQTLTTSFDIYVFGTKGISLNLEGRIIINYYTEYPNYEDVGYTPGVLFFKQNEEPTQNEISSAYGSGLGVTDFYIEDGYLIFQYDKLAAKELSENVYIVTYAVEDGNPVFGAPQKFRVMDYKNMVFSGSSDTKLLTLIVDMLNYGSAAQTYFSHNTSTLANSDLTKAQKAYATSTTPTVRKRTTAYSDSLSSSNVKIKSASISLDNEIVVNYYATIDAGEREIESANLLVFDNFEDEQTYDKTTADKTYEMFIPQGKEEYCGNIPNIVAKDMRKLFYARVHVTYTDGTEEYSSIRSFSVEDYAYQALNTPSASQGLKDLMKAMIKYGDSASSYLNSKGD